MRAARHATSTIRIGPFALFAMVGVLLIGLFGTSPATAATTITVTTTVTAEAADAACGLAEAIIAANTDTAYKGCPAGSGADTIVLPSGTYTLTAAAYSNPNTDGPDGLPPITGVLTVQGLGGATITRLASAPDFRILESTSPATLTLRDLTITGGHLGDQNWAGGGILNCGVLALVRVTVADNWAGDDGGGLGDNNCDNFDNLDITITDSSFLRNIGDNGGAMTAYYFGRLVISGGTFADNIARTGDAAAVYADADTSITDSSFSRNLALGQFGSGGAIESGGNLTVTHSVFTSNQTTNEGGAIDTCCVHPPDKLTIVDSTFNDNRSTTGGAIAAFFEGTVDITGSTFAGNQATGAGGALFTWRDTFNVTNSTFTGNTANKGGAVANRSTPGFGFPSVFNLTNVTMSGNGATTGGNIHNEATAIASDAYTVTNSIIASPLSGGNCVGLIVNGGHDIGFGDATCTGFGTGNPQLQPLGNNGGPTQTMALGSGSAALDQIPPASSCPATDQRGVTRPQNALCDIGAYEQVMSGITTQASPGGLVGVAVTDTATVTGFNPTGTVSFDLFSGSGCMNNVGSSPGRPLAGGTATSAPITPNAPGTYYWTAVYSGDTLNPPATSPCGAPNESVTITAPASTATVLTSILNPSAFGAAVTFTATVSAGSGTPTGTVQFKVDGANLGSPVALAGGTAMSPPISTLAAGTHAVTADYSGAAGFAASSGTLTQTVTKASQAITFTSTAPTNPPVGSTYTVTATGGASGNPVTFTSATPSTCTVSGSTVSFIGLGTCTINANQAGNANYNPAPQVTQTMTVVKASPTIATVASAGGPVGSTPVRDVATLSGGAGPTGSVVFKLFSDSGCATQKFTSTNNLSGASATSAPDFTPITVGTFYWTAVYGGDAKNNAATSPCQAANESVTIVKATPTISTVASPGNLVGAPVRDTATVAGGFGPTGTVTFKLFSDANCTTQVSTSTNPLGTPSDWFTPATAGTYRWTATYNGDANNNSVSGACNAPNESVTLAPFTAPTYTRTIEGDLQGPVTVTSGESVLIKPGARVVGPVTVAPGGALTVQNAQISRGIVVDNPRFLSICGSDVSAPSPATALSVSNAAVPIRIGDPANGCAANRFAGQVTLTANLATTFGTNTVSGAATVTNGGPGLTVIKANTVLGTLACSGNTPAPTNAGQTNTAGAKTGQCTGV